MLANRNRNTAGCDMYCCVINSFPYTPCPSWRRYDQLFSLVCFLPPAAQLCFPTIRRCCMRIGSILISFIPTLKETKFNRHTDKENERSERNQTHHHLVDGVHNIQHLISSYVAIIVEIVKFKCPCNITRANMSTYL